MFPDTAMKTSPSRRGFTLIELLVTISIVAILSAMAWGGATVMLRRSKEKKTYTMIQQVGGKLEDYRADKAYYPEPASTDKTVEISGESWPSGGASCIYQALTGDGDSEIKGLEHNPSKGETGWAGKVYMENIQPPSEIDIRNNKQVEWVSVIGESYFLIDAFRHPLVYTLAKKDKNKQVVNVEEMFSSGDYDLYSFGALTKAENTEDKQLKWISNWGGAP